MAAPLHTEILSITGLKLPNFGIDEDPAVWYRVHYANLPATDRKNIEQAAAALRKQGGLPVAFPTETVYGLGANATESDAVKAIYKAKNRPADNPLIVHIASRQQLDRLLGATKMPELYEPLISAFWPGPLTIVLPLPISSENTVPYPAPLAPEITHGLRTFGARMPHSSMARLLIALADRPIAAPSANTSGKPSPTTAQHVYEDLQGRINLILDGGSCGVGLESTVVSGLAGLPAILRPGGITLQQIRELGGAWSSTYQKTHKPGENEVLTPAAPGMKYKHYAPQGTVLLLEHGNSQITAINLISKDSENRKSQDVPLHIKIAVVRTCKSNWLPFLGYPDAPDEDNWDEKRTLAVFPKMTEAMKMIRGALTEVFDFHLGPTAADVARDLFATLRACDELGCTLIVVEGLVEDDGIAMAVMERLRKAASQT